MNESVAVEQVGRARMSSSSRAGRRSLVRNFVKRPIRCVALVIVMAFVVVAIFAPLIAPYSPSATDFTAILSGPSGRHLLGTDELGRDVLSRLIWGSRASIAAGVAATMIAMTIAVPVGVTAGYYRRWTDAFISRSSDVVLAFPVLVLAIGLSAILGPSLLSVALALGISAVPRIVRIARGEALALREADFVRAAILNGASDVVVLVRHIIPNMTSTLVIQATVLIPAGIIGEATLSFLGLGVQPPTPSWGVMLSDSQAYLTSEPRLAIAPGLAIFICALAFNLLGDGLRDVLDPHDDA